MTAAQRSAIYGDSPNGPKQTSNVSQAQAEVKQKALVEEKRHQDALNSDTVAVDFAHQAELKATPAVAPAVLGEHDEMPPRTSTEAIADAMPEADESTRPTGAQAVRELQPKKNGKSDPMPAQSALA
jgi:type IV secretion system protein VirB10